MNISSNEYFIRYPKTGMGLNPEGLYGSKLLGDYRDGNFVEALRASIYLDTFSLMIGRIGM